MRHRILMGGCQAATRSLVAFTLMAEGHELITAASGLETLKQARAYLPDFIILDCTLQDLDGPSVCDILRRLPSTADIPVLLLTSLSDQLAGRALPSSAAHNCLVKPFTPAELMQRVNAALAPWQQPEPPTGSFENDSPEPDMIGQEPHI